jgi:hypothetical protein
VPFYFSSLLSEDVRLTLEIDFSSVSISGPILGLTTTRSVEPLLLLIRGVAGLLRVCLIGVCFSCSATN